MADCSQNTNTRTTRVWKGERDSTRMVLSYHTVVTTTTRLTFYYLHYYFIILAIIVSTRKNQQAFAFVQSSSSSSIIISRQQSYPSTTNTLNPILKSTTTASLSFNSNHNHLPFRGGRDDTTITTCTRRRSPTKLQMSSASLLTAATATATSTTTTAAAATMTTSFYLVRILFLRGLAFVYGIAFLVAHHQNKALIGDTGITPARQILNAAEIKAQATRQRRQEWLATLQNSTTISQSPLRSMGYWINQQGWYQTLREKLWDRSDRLNRPLTTLLWFAKDRSKLNPWLDRIALTGISLSCLMFVLGAANVPLLLTLWICQRSLMAVGGPWYGYGWEPQLAELGFHAMFLVPLLSVNPFHSSQVPIIPIWAMRWFLFRIMMGAGLIKLKGDDKWKKLSAMDYFYETQPVPNPLSKYFHWMPLGWHKFEVLTNHFVELPAPFLLILPGIPVNWRRTGGFIQMVFQMVLISSGNLSFLNWLTALPAIFCFDDALVSKVFSETAQTAAITAASLAATTPSCWIRRVVNISFAVLIGKLSIPVVRNLCAKKQIMNTSFDPLRLVNTYGAFGSVNDVRAEFIISSSPHPDGPWKEYEFKVKPGNIKRRPRWISPYHYRLDWQMWIACTVGNINRSPWIYNFLLKLLEQDKGVLQLLANDPWNQQEQQSSKNGAGDNDSDHSTSQTDLSKPKYIRIEKYKYNYHKKKSGEKEHPYWDREFVSKVFPRKGVISADELKDILKIL